MDNQNVVTKAGKKVWAEYQEFSDATKATTEKAILKGYALVGGEAAANDEKASMDAFRAGNIGESVKYSTRVNGDILSHVTRRDHGGQSR